jgi:3-methyladenine DNA glycosylase Tag
MQFQTIRARAEQRKGGKNQLEMLLPSFATNEQLRQQGDDRYLSKMTQSINNAGFNWKVIANKWPQFEEAFFGFNPTTLSMLSPEQWENYQSDRRVVRHAQKIKAVYDNVLYIFDIQRQHGSFGNFLAEWPSNDFVGLLAHMKKYGSRLGGNTGQWFLRHAGKDGFVMTGDVVATIQACGVDIADNPTSKRDHQKIQDTFNRWHDESGLPYCHLSRIAACSVGINRL